MREGVCAVQGYIVLVCFASPTNFEAGEWLFSAGQSGGCACLHIHTVLEELRVSFCVHRVGRLITPALQHISCFQATRQTGSRSVAARMDLAPVRERWCVSESLFHLSTKDLGLFVGRTLLWIQGGQGVCTAARQSPLLGTLIKQELALPVKGSVLLVVRCAV
ncbi:unnamed protein product [Discosporangium mesarthrocarpum]